MDSSDPEAGNRRAISREAISLDDTNRRMKPHWSFGMEANYVEGHVSSVGNLLCAYGP